MLAALGNSWESSVAALSYYVLIYVVANMAVFTIIAVVEQNNGGKTNIADYMDSTKPIHALASL